MAFEYEKFDVKGYLDSSQADLEREHYTRSLNLAGGEVDQDRIQVLEEQIAGVKAARDDLAPKKKAAKK